MALTKILLTKKKKPTNGLVQKLKNPVKFIKKKRKTTKESPNVKNFPRKFKKDVICRIKNKIYSKEIRLKKLFLPKSSPAAGSPTATVLRLRTSN